MKKKLILFIIFIIFVINLVTLFSILNFIDPLPKEIDASIRTPQTQIIGLVGIAITFIIGLSSFLTLALYFMKLIYYRGEVFLLHIFTSMRQAILATIFALGMIIFNKFGVLTHTIGGVYLALIIFIELLISNLEK